MEAPRVLLLLLDGGALRLGLALHAPAVAHGARLERLAGGLRADPRGLDGVALAPGRGHGIHRRHLHLHVDLVLRGDLALDRGLLLRPPRRRLRVKRRRGRHCEVEVEADGCRRRLHEANGEVNGVARGARGLGEERDRGIAVSVERGKDGKALVLETLLVQGVLNFDVERRRRPAEVVFRGAYEEVVLRDNVEKGGLERRVEETVLGGGRA
mmetsp:Transcript_15994/g.41123  ORF Transcript_15994/g.41123 Transcript_15994/m.41123 type:complete len:212 (-) Transcript_15994:299-934(-)